MIQLIGVYSNSLVTVEHFFLDAYTASVIICINE